MAGRFVGLVRLVSRQPQVFGRVAVKPMAVAPSLIVRHFGHNQSHLQTKPEPFLDTKVVTERILSVIKNYEKVNPAKVTDAARFKEDLDLDSLDAVELVMAIEEEFNIEIPDAEADKILSVQDAVKYVSAHPMAK
eukprot:gene10877-11853_t